jgi:hypothetical protein
VNANHVEPGRYVLVASTADINFGKIALSNGSTGLVTLDDSVPKEIAVVVKRPGLAIIVR